MKTFRQKIAFASLAMATVAMPSSVHGQSVASFYERQTVTLYIGLEVGGGYDLYGRLLARHLGRHIPGNPTVVPKNRTGAGGMVLANSLFNVENRDGTVVAILSQSAAVAQRLGYPGVKYD